MENFRQACPQCQATLELPLSAIGRNARCPACQHTFQVTGPQNAAGPQAAPVTPNPDSLTPGSARPDGTSDSANPFGDLAARPPAKSTADNPYAAPVTTGYQEAVPRGELNLQRVRMDYVLSNGWEIFCARWQPLVLAGLLYFVFSIGVGFAIGIAAAVAGMQNPQQLMLITVALGTALAFVTYYLQLGIQRLSIRVSRGEQTEFQNAFATPAQFFRLLPLLLVLIAIGVGTQLVVQNLQAQIENGDVEPVMMFAGVGIQLVGGIITAIVLLFTWPIMYLIADDRPNAYATGFSIATQNLLVGFLIWWILQFLLQIAAMFSCGLGMIVTQPMLLLFGAVAYLGASGQRISSPSYTPLPQSDYSPEKPAPY